MRNFIAWRQPGLYDVDEASLESATDNKEPSLTIQSMGPETEISAIIKRYGLTGELPVRRLPEEYGSFDEALDFRAMLEFVKHGENIFSALPSELRGRFGNDPALFMDWINDPINRDEAVKIGLLVKDEGDTREVVPSLPSAAVVQKEVVKGAENVAASEPLKAEPPK